MASQNGGTAPKKGVYAEAPAAGSFKRSAQECHQRRRLRHCKSAPQQAEATIVTELNNLTKSVSPPELLRLMRPSFRYILFYFSAFVAIGVICFYTVRNEFQGKHTNRFVDAVYITITTITTVGFGDFLPDSVATKLLATAFVFSGMALCGIILSKGADYLVEKQEAMLVKAMHSFQENSSAIDVMKEIETKKVQYKVIIMFSILVVLMTIGTVFLYTAESMPLIDAFYCVVATITTLGYGLPSFKSLGGRIFAIFWILMSTISVALFYLYIAQFAAERKQKELVKVVLSRRMTNLDIEAADIDNDGVVEAAEFVVYKLKEMGKITTEDVTAILKEFEELDVDQSGFLTVSDITVAQSSPAHPTPPAKKSHEV